MENAKVCTVLVWQPEADSAPSYLEMQKRVEKAGQQYMAKKSGEGLASVLEELLIWMMNGETYPKLLMHVIRYMVNCDDHRVKKLLQLYFELCDKITGTGELKEEMILVCNALLKDLNSHNEFVRGSTLRLLCRLRYYKLIEPLITSIMQNLQHRHSYVRRYAVICVYGICKSFGVHAVPGASEGIEAVLITEGDMSTKRNCLLFLLQFDIDKCVRYVLSLGEQISQSLGDICQLVVVELCRKIAKLDYQLYVNKFRPLLFNLSIQTNSPAVAYEACICLLSFSGGELSVQEGINKLVQLLFSQSDNAVKLVILDRLEELKSELLAESTLDLLRALSTNPSTSVRRRILNLTMAAVTTNAKNAELVLNSLVKELVAKHDLNDSAKVDILNAIRTLSPSISSLSFVDPLLDEITGSSAPAATVALATLRDLWCTGVHRPTESHLAKLRSVLVHIKAGPEVVRSVLWLLGEVDHSCQPLLSSLLTAVGVLPLTNPDLINDTPDASNKFRKNQHKNHFRAALFKDDLLRSVLALVVARAALRGAAGRQFNEAVFLVANLARIESASGRVAVVLRALTTANLEERAKLLALAASGADLARQTLHATLAKKSRFVAGEADAETEEQTTSSGTSVTFRQLSTVGVASDVGPGGGGSLFTKEGLEEKETMRLDERLERTMALTGMSDAVYVEGCIVGVREHGTMQLELWVYNRTSEVVQNVSIDLFPEGERGGLRVVEKENLTQIGILKGGEARRVQVNVKVEMTQSARLHGYVSFEDKKNKKTQLVMAPVETDILDFFPRRKSGGISVETFKTMWAELEWENKVNVWSGGEGKFETILEKIMKTTNMEIIADKLGELLKIDFISVNLVGKSIFGEDVLANVSLQVEESRKIAGSVRIRARTQGIALSMGDRINKILGKQ